MCNYGMCFDGVEQKLQSVNLNEYMSIQDSIHVIIVLIFL